MIVRKHVVIIAFRVDVSCDEDVLCEIVWYRNETWTSARETESDMN